LLGKHLGRGGVLDLLAAAMLARSPRLAKTQPVKILAALDAQTLVVPGTAEFGRVIAGVAAQLRDVSTERAALAEDLEARLEAHPLAEVLTSMPGVGLRTAIKILSEALLGGFLAGVLDGADDGPGVLPRPGPGNGGGELGVGLVHRGVGGGDPVQDVERRLGRQPVGGNAFAEGGAAGVAVSAQRDRAVADDGAELAVRSAGGLGRVGTADRPAVKAVLTTHSGRRGRGRVDLRGRVHLQALPGAVAAGLVGGAVLPAVPDHALPRLVRVRATSTWSGPYSGSSIRSARSCRSRALSGRLSSRHALPRLVRVMATST
jgi:hypothetical protein